MTNPIRIPTEPSTGMAVICATAAAQILGLTDLPERIAALEKQVAQLNGTAHAHGGYSSVLTTTDPSAGLSTIYDIMRAHVGPGIAPLQPAHVAAAKPGKYDMSEAECARMAYLESGYVVAAGEAALAHQPAGDGMPTSLPVGVPGPAPWPDPLPPATTAEEQTERDRRFREAMAPNTVEQPGDDGMAEYNPPWEGFCQQRRLIAALRAELAAALTDHYRLALERNALQSKADAAHAELVDSKNLHAKDVSRLVGGRDAARADADALRRDLETERGIVCKLGALSGRQERDADALAGLLGRSRVMVEEITIRMPHHLSWEHGIQDPLGAHGLLAEIDAALAKHGGGG